MLFLVLFSFYTLRLFIVFSSTYVFFLFLFLLAKAGVCIFFVITTLLCFRCVGEKKKSRVLYPSLSQSFFLFLQAYFRSFWCLSWDSGFLLEYM